jgi:hypothetical protein
VVIGNSSVPWEGAFHDDGPARIRKSKSIRSHNAALTQAHALFMTLHVLPLFIYVNLCYDRRRRCPAGVGPVGSEPGPARRGTSQLDRTQANRATSGLASAEPWHYRINRQFPPLGGGKRFACNDRERR